MAQRVPIDGEAGFGYVLDPKYDMPPLALSPEEIEAVLLGVQMVERLGDPAITIAARDVIAKIARAIPSELHPFITESTVHLKPTDVTHDLTFDTRPVRRAIREGRKTQLDYRAANGELTHRVVWPILLGYTDAHCLLIAWCESKQDFRHFRTERILDIAILEDNTGVPRRKLREQWLQWRDAQLAHLRSTP